MPKVTKQQEVTVVHTDMNGKNIDDGGKAERLVRGQAKWTTGGRRTDGTKEKGGQE